MQKNRLLFASFVIILALALLHYFSLKLSWYFTFRWLDIIAHILGGFWVSVTVFWLLLSKTVSSAEENVLKPFWPIVISILCMGIAWEIFEYLSGNTFIYASNFYTDSLFDLLNNFLGGILAYGYIIRSQK